MKLRILPLGMAAIALCSASVAFAGEVVRASKAHAVTRSALRASRAKASDTDGGAGTGGASKVPIFLAAAAGGGAIIYFATRHDQNASR